MGYRAGTVTNQEKEFCGSIPDDGHPPNVLNRLNANNPTAILGSASFGRILTAAEPRIMQLAMKFMF
jgi:hypothetical protein